MTGINTTSFRSGVFLSGPHLLSFFPVEIALPPEVAEEGLARPVVAGVVATLCFLAAAVLFSTLAAFFVNKQRRQKLKRKPGASRQAGATYWLPCEPPHHFQSGQLFIFTFHFSFPSRSPSVYYTHQKECGGCVSNPTLHALHFLHAAFVCRVSQGGKFNSLAMLCIVAILDLGPLGTVSHKHATKKNFN